MQGVRDKNMNKTKLLLISILLFSILSAPAYANQDLNDRLFKAIEKLDLKAVKQTLNEGADPNHIKIYGTFPNTVFRILTIYYSGSALSPVMKTEIDNETYEIAKLLFENGAKLRQADAEILYSPIVYGNVKLVNLFLENGASPHQKLGGLSPVELAITNNQTQVAELLKKHGAIPANSKNILQINLVNAAIDGDPQKIEAAIQKGADVNKPDSAGRYALLEMLQFPFFSENALKVLLDSGADPNMLCDSSTMNLQKTSPLHIYIIMTAKAVERVVTKNIAREVKSNIKLLLDYGAYTSIKDAHGMTPLHSAAKTNHVVAAKLLIKKGAKIYDKDYNGKMPIDYAQSSQMINLLQENNKENLIYIYILLSVIVGLFAIIALLIKKKKSYL
jgi:ankyrin repeat protein